MNNGEFKKLLWGVFFIMLNFRIQGFDILPDVLGYIFLALGFSALSSGSDYFRSAAKFNIPMIFLSLLSVYQGTAQTGQVNFGPFGLLGIPIAIASLIFNLFVFYYMFLGIQDMANKQELYPLAQEAEKRWNQYKWLQIASILAFVVFIIPPLAFMYITVLFVLAIILAIVILGFLKRCDQFLNTEPNN
jgi:hypothetical protein